MTNIHRNQSSVSTEGDQIILEDDSFNKYTLSFNSQDKEIDYVHLSIKRKRFIMLFNFVFLNIFSLFNEGILMKNHFSSAEGPVLIFRALNSLFGIVCVYMIFFWKRLYFEEMQNKKYQELDMYRERTAYPKFKRYNEINIQKKVWLNIDTITVEQEQELKKCLKIQRIFYYLIYFCITMNQVSFFYILQAEVKDENSEELDLEYRFQREQLRMLYLGMNVFATLIAILIINIHYLYSLFHIAIFCIIAISFQQNRQISQYVTFCYKYVSVGLSIGWIMILYIDEYVSKENYQSQQKVKRLIREQRNILEKLPDGLIIHQNKGKNLEANVKYLNSTFTSMFMISSDSSQSCLNVQSQIKNLDKIYLQKTCYQIKNQQVEQIDIDIEQPKSLIRQISKFESGQVFEIVYKDTYTGNFISNYEMIQKFQQNDEIAPEEYNKFLIYIFSEKVYINDELHNMTIIKDITFGVLYEQIKAQQNLKSIVNTTLKKKIGMPLQVLVKSCNNLLETNQLQLFEEFQARNSNLSNHLKQMVIQCKSVIFKLSDMQDWQQIQLGNFRKRNICFCLQKVIQDVEKLMKSKAENKNLTLKITANFEKETQMVEMISLQGILMEILVKKNQNHPLFLYLAEYENNSILPKSMIGDPDRLQQVAVNIIQNAIDNSFRGTINIHVQYDKKKGLIVFIVNDSGIGINEFDKGTIFQVLGHEVQKEMLLSDGKKMGLGLYISKQIVMKFGGDIDFVSEQHKGSTFIFSMELEYDEDKEQLSIEQNEFDNMQCSPRFNKEDSHTTQNYTQQPIVLIDNSNTVAQSFGGQNC